MAHQASPHPQEPQRATDPLSSVMRRETAGVKEGDTGGSPKDTHQVEWPKSHATPILVDIPHTAFVLFFLTNIVYGALRLVKHNTFKSTDKATKDRRCRLRHVILPHLESFNRGRRKRVTPTPQVVQI